MKKTLAIITLLFSVLIASSFKSPGPEAKAKLSKSKPLCTLALPSVSISTSGAYTIITISGGSGDGFTIGGYYRLLSDGNFGICPASGSEWILTKSHGTFRVTAWCGSCQNATASIVSGPYTF